MLHICMQIIYTLYNILIKRFPTVIYKIYMQKLRTLSVSVDMKVNNTMNFLLLLQKI